MTLYEWLTAFLVGLSADPAAMQAESPKAAAAVAIAYAGLPHDATPAPQPAPKVTQPPCPDGKCPPQLKR